MEIGVKIKQLRLQRGLTQEELAARTELTKGFISQLERDLTSPSIATLMDILARWHRMKGDDVLWQPGLDHAGIATQMVVERQLAAAGNLGRRDMGREAFVEKVWD